MEEKKKMYYALVIRVGLINSRLILLKGINKVTLNVNI